MCVCDRIYLYMRNGEKLDEYLRSVIYDIFLIPFFVLKLHFGPWVIVADIPTPVRGFISGLLSIPLFILMVWFQPWVVVADIPGPVRRRSVFHEFFMFLGFLFVRIQHRISSLCFLLLYSVFVPFVSFVDETVA